MAGSAAAAGDAFEPLSFLGQQEIARDARGERVARPLAPALDDLAEAPASAADLAPEPGPDAIAEAVPEPEPSFGRAELDEAVRAAREEALREGAAEGRAEAEAAIGRRLADAVDALVAALRTQVEVQERAAARRKADLDLALGIVRCVVPRTLEQAPLADVEPMLADLMAGLAGQSSIELRLSPDLLEPGRAVLAEVARKSGYAGEVSVVPDPDLELGDACLHWDHGLAERRVGAIVDEVERVLRARDGDPGSDDETARRATAGAPATKGEDPT